MTVLLSAQDLAKSYAHRPLFRGLALDLRAGEKVGLIGPNGAGKSTLLKILAGVEVPDDGIRTVRRGTRIGYVTQDDTFPEGKTVAEVIVDWLADDGLEDYERESRAAIALTQVGFDDHEQAASSLSGGWRKRLAIARALARRPEFLLLDEPTNHLDLPGVVWLEKLLRAAPFGYLAATHDRAFLRGIADDILEVSRVYPGGAFRADGGYDAFEDKKFAFLEAQARKQESVANRVRQETEWLGHKARARTRKASSRIEAAADRRDELSELKYRTAASGAAGIDFAGSGRQTKKLITATGVSKTLGGKPLFAGVDLILSPGMKLGLLGVNGSGKSTLLKVLGGDLTPDDGVVTRADGLRSVVFEQGRASLDQKSTLRRALSPNGDNVTYRDKTLHVAAWAQRFLFQAEQLDLELSALSGGEQARVRIAQLMLTAADVLLLDEPTNDLDIPALEVLEDSLSEFPGAVILVSHDRDLMSRLCTEFVGLDGKGASGMYGSVDQWLTVYDTTAKEAKPGAAKGGKAAGAAKVKKLNYRDQQEWDRMEATILAAEQTVEARQRDVEAAATARRDVLTAACKSLESAQRAVEKLYARWQELDARRG
ncbi:MAG: ABC-F family ATP-binding cassette domain-containing protein [Fimbriiglobus sp.]